MKLYILGARGRMPGYDECNGMVIRASDAKRARQLAHSRYPDEQRWNNPKLSSCRKLTAKGKEEIVLIDFSAG